MTELSHFDKEGKIKMVDVSDKQVTSRVAIASGKVLLNQETITKIKEETNPKGNPLEIARIAGIMGAKKTSDVIPLCHQLHLSKVDVKISIEDTGIRIEAVAKTSSQLSLIHI